MFIYLHGFNSSGQSAKGQYFRTNFHPREVFTPSYPAQPAEAIHYLASYIENCRKESQSDQEIILIGSSLGGYYAQYLARQFNLANVLINPALQPVETLQAYLGWQTNYYTGERYFFDQELLTQLLAYDIPSPCDQEVPTLLLLDEADEIIDYRVARTRYLACARVIVYPGGDHQFQHLKQATQAILAFSMAQ